mmetsp:Transcript_125844/g.218025  ORF Transcript_125844/g.218025 Transcript_125844/m.218025 type:complete len:205 (+) Transcript_125844:58-672(+)
MTATQAASAEGMKQAAPRGGPSAQEGAETRTAWLYVLGTCKSAATFRCPYLLSKDHSQDFLEVSESEEPSVSSSKPCFFSAFFSLLRISRRCARSEALAEGSARHWQTASRSSDFTPKVSDVHSTSPDASMAEVQFSSPSWKRTRPSQRQVREPGVLHSDQDGSTSFSPKRFKPRWTRRIAVFVAINTCGSMLSGISSCFTFPR